MSTHLFLLLVLNNHTHTFCVSANLECKNMRFDCDGNDDEVLPPQEERLPIAAAKCSAIAVAAYILIVA